MVKNDIWETNIFIVLLQKQCLHIPFYLHEQYLDDFLNLKAERDKVFLGKGRVGGEYTVPVAIV